MSEDPFIPEEYRIVVYLDTNVLVDYALSQNDMLTQSLKWMQKCPFVRLQSSRYVEFELTEVLKYLFFIYKVDGSFPQDNKIKNNIKNSNWVYKNIDYMDVKGDIINEVEEAKNRITTELEVDFLEHPLVDKLLKPTLEVCLKTRISKEDSLVLASGSDNGNSFFTVLSNDSQFSKEIKESNELIISILSEASKCVPHELNIKELADTNGKVVNLACDMIPEDELSILWTSIILKLIQKKNQKRFLGKTYVFGKYGKSAQCVYFKLPEIAQEMPSHNGLSFISKDLSGLISLSELTYWNNGLQVSQLPHPNHIDGKYSFCSEKLSQTQLEHLREDGHYVFMSID